MAGMRLWEILVSRRLASDRRQAEAIIMSGKVLVDDQKATKPGMGYGADAQIRVISRGKGRFVSRGGEKLSAAFTHWGLCSKVDGCLAIDIGSSTGGFTDCLLQMGARQVFAVDVGSCQLDWRLRSDSRVICHENTNIKDFIPPADSSKFDFVVADLSFTSITYHAEQIARFHHPDTLSVLLIKPQFELGRELVGPKGIVAEERLHTKAIEQVTGTLSKYGLDLVDIFRSPVLGRFGNQEYFALLRARG